ncbi:MAG: hypothetical protein AB7L13_03265 [Acidimicrobiia bacterium]
MRCSEVVDDLIDVAGGGTYSTLGAEEHVGRCLRCQAELAGYRRLLRSLGRLSTATIDPGPVVLGAILANLDHSGHAGGWSGRRIAYLGGLAAATAGAAAGAIVIGTRSRRGRARAG